MPLLESVTDLADGAEVLVRRRYGVIEAAEARLRSGRPLPDDVPIQLEAAYRSVGRKNDAKRAATSDPEPTPATSAMPGRNTAPGAGMF